MHYRVLAQCCPSDLQKDISGWVRENPNRTVEDVFDLLRAEFQVSDAFGDTHNWESLKLDAPGGKLTLAVWGTWKREWDRLRSLVSDSTPHQEYKLVMKALPQRYFHAVRQEEQRLGRKTHGARFMGPEVTGAELEDFVKSRMSCVRKLKYIQEYSNSWEVFFSREDDRDDFVRLDGKRLQGHPRPMRVAPIPFQLSPTEIFDFVRKKILGEQRDQVWSKAVRSDQAPDNATTKTQGKPHYHSNTKKVREVEASQGSKPKEAGKPNEGGKKGSLKKGSAKKGKAKVNVTEATPVAAVAAGKLQPPVTPKATGLEDMVIPSPNWPKHPTPPGPDFRGCHYCLVRDLHHDHDSRSCAVKAEAARRRDAYPYQQGKGGGKGKGGGQGKGSSY